jgi:hypothetical protein
VRAMEDFEQEDLACPHCGSTNIRRSRNIGMWAAIQRIFGRWPFRCRSCRRKFYRSADPPEDY